MMSFDKSEAKKVSLRAYLQAYGFRPVKKETGEYLYLSPLRLENTPSFRVREKAGNNGEDLWFDFGLGGQQGGDIIALVQRLHSIHSVDEVIKHLKAYKAGFIVGGNLQSTNNENKTDFLEKTGINILGEPKPLNHFVLLKYLREDRKIPDHISQEYLSLIYYKHNNSKNQKHYFGFGWLNESGAYEIRGAGENSFKSVTGKKDITVINSKSQSGNIYVFEAMLDYLSALVLKETLQLNGTTIILNGASMINRVMIYLKNRNFSIIHVFVDNDQAGEQAYLKLTQFFDKNVLKRHDFYAKYKDVNEYLVAKKT